MQFVNKAYILAVSFAQRSQKIVMPYQAIRYFDSLVHRNTVKTANRKKSLTVSNSQYSRCFSSGTFGNSTDGKDFISDALRSTLPATLIPVKTSVSS